MKYRIIAVATLVVLVSGCTSTGGEPQDAERMPTDSGETSELAEETGETNTVYYTSSGFQPSTVTIEQGETVRWVNNASSGMWVASDNHPRHTNYAGTSVREHCDNGDQTSAAFDQCSMKKQFTFTFEKTGTWEYHNHVNSGDTGSVVVE